LFYASIRIKYVQLQLKKNVHLNERKKFHKVISIAYVIVQRKKGPKSLSCIIKSLSNWVQTKG